MLGCPDEDFVMPRSVVLRCLPEPLEGNFSATFV